MVELVDTQDLKSCSRKRSAGSIPALSTYKIEQKADPTVGFFCSVALHVLHPATNRYKAVY